MVQIRWECEGGEDTEASPMTLQLSGEDKQWFEGVVGEEIIQDFS
jgi:hypothetical protein